MNYNTYQKIIHKHDKLNANFNSLLNLKYLNDKKQDQEIIIKNS